MPRVSDSATFSAAWRQIEQRRNSASPSFHSFVVRSIVRGGDATVNDATAAPDGVKRSSGSAVRLPTTVMTVSPATSALFRAQNLGPQDGLVQVQLAVEFEDGRGFGLEVDDRVDALAVLVDLVGEPALAPDVDLVHRATVVLDHVEERVEGRSDGALFQGGVEDDHYFVVTHGCPIPPVDSGGHGRSVAGGARPSQRRKPAGARDAGGEPAQPTPPQPLRFW